MTERFYVGGYQVRRDLGQCRPSPMAPSEEVGGSPGIGAARPLITDTGGEELDKAIYCSRPFTANRHRYKRPTLRFRMKILWVPLAFHPTTMPEKWRFKKDVLIRSASSLLGFSCACWPTQLAFFLTKRMVGYANVRFRHSATLK